MALVLLQRADPMEVELGDEQARASAHANILELAADASAGNDAWWNGTDP